jgi:hypothetical protein
MRGGSIMKKKKLKTFIFIVNALILFGLYLTNASDVWGEESENLFLIKKYGELEPYEAYPTERTPSRYEKLFLENQGLVKESRMFYSLPGGAIQSSASVAIYEFTDPVYAKNELLIQLYYRKASIDYVTINGMQVVQIVSPYWVSGNKYISTYVFNVDDPQPIYKDYLSLHPPTVNIQESDFDTREIVKVQVMRIHELNKEADKMRLLPARKVNKAEAYIGMVVQCGVEYSIRCYTGMYEGEYVSCPITMIKEDISRKMKWKKFREESISRPIVEENVNWGNLGSVEPKCRFQAGEIKPGDDTRIKLDVRWMMWEELNMSAADLEQLTEKPPDGIFPTMFE